jgi:hypothetical protein
MKVSAKSISDQFICHRKQAQVFSKILKSMSRPDALHALLFYSMEVCIT